MGKKLLATLLLSAAILSGCGLSHSAQKVKYHFRDGSTSRVFDTEDMTGIIEDFNRDGKPDILAISKYKDRVIIYIESNRDGSYTWSIW